MNSLAGVGVGLALILLNGFFVAAEFAMVRLRGTRARALAHVHGVRGRILLRISRHLDVYLSATQLGITLASLGLGWIGEPAMAQLLAPVFEAVGGAPAKVVEGVSFGTAFVLIAFVHIVLGELAPKSLAIRKVEPVSLWTGVPLYLFYWIFFPAIWILNNAATLILKAFRLGGVPAEESPHTREELRMILALSQARGTLGRRTGDILERVLEFAELTAGDLMRPAADMVCLMTDATPEENRRVMERYRYTRYPVCRGDRQHVVGLLHVKDAFAALSQGRPLGKLGALLRPLPSVPKHLPAMDLLSHFRLGHPHFALVVDDLGTITGFVTLDHVLEALVGEIQDEFRHQKTEWERLPDESLLGAGSLSLYSLERALGFPMPETEADTIGGLIMHQLERLPVVGERVDFEDFDVVVLEMAGPRILKVQVFAHPREAEEGWFA